MKSLQQNPTKLMANQHLSHAGTSRQTLSCFGLTLNTSLALSQVGCSISMLEFHASMSLAFMIPFEKWMARSSPASRVLGTDEGIAAETNKVDKKPILSRAGIDNRNLLCCGLYKHRIGILTNCMQHIDEI